MFETLQERIGVARFTTTKTVVIPRLGPNVEARAALIVKWAQALQGTDSGRFYAHMIAHDVGNICAGLDLVNIALSNPACHGYILSAQRKRAVVHNRVLALSAHRDRIDVANSVRSDR